MFSFRNTQRVAVMAQEVPTPFGELECLERYFSLRDLYNLSKTCTSWQRYAIKTFTGSYAARLVQVLEACSPELKAVLTERKLSTESTAVADPLMQLWTVVSHLQQGEAWQIALAEYQGLSMTSADLAQDHMFGSCRSQQQRNYSRFWV